MIPSVFTTYLDDETGALSIESILWVSIMFLVTAVFIDSTAMFNAQTRVLRIAQDADRAYSLGFIETPADVEAYIEGRLSAVSPTVDAISTVTTTPNGDVITTTVTLPATDFQIFGSIPAFSGLTINVAAMHLVEDV